MFSLSEFIILVEVVVSVQRLIILLHLDAAETGISVELENKYYNNEDGKLITVAARSKA
jgi:hypothetical protein